MVVRLDSSTPGIPIEMKYGDLHELAKGDSAMIRN